MALQDVVSIEESLFTVWFDPHLVFAVLCENVEASDVQLERASLGEFAEDGAGRQEIVFANVSGHLENLCADVIHSFSMETEDVISILPIDEELDVRTHILGQFFEEGLRFLLG